MSLILPAGAKFHLLPSIYTTMVSFEMQASIMSLTLPFSKLVTTLDDEINVMWVRGSCVRALIMK